MGRMSDNSTIRYRGEIDYAQRSARREIFLREKESIVDRRNGYDHDFP